MQSLKRKTFHVHVICLGNYHARRARQKVFKDAISFQDHHHLGWGSSQKTNSRGKLCMCVVLQEKANYYWYVVYVTGIGDVQILL